MLPLKDFYLPNGLQVAVNENHDVQIAVVDIIYKVGSRNDFQNKKGIAHLFEHLMFCGSKNAENYDIELQNVGGNNNAYTNSDITNFYCTVPSINIETAFWLESDRMFNLSLDEESIDIQKKVVTEELKESYYGSPYGDMYLNLLPLLYTKDNPYFYPTIGFEDHIASVTKKDVQDFYSFYSPSNAILVVSGDVDYENIKKLSEKYFSCNSKSFTRKKACITDALIKNKSEYFEKIITKDIPSECVFLAYKTCSCLDKRYYANLLLCEILDCGRSSLLYKVLVDEKKIFSSLSVELEDNELEGFFMISGFVNNDVDLDFAIKELLTQIDYIIENGFSNKEVLKAKNNFKMEYLYSSLDVTKNADAIANSYAIGDINFINEHLSRLEAVTKNDIVNELRSIFFTGNRFILKYKKH